MIELLSIVATDARYHVRQQLVPPVVYLDTWAICEFSENEALGRRLRGSLFRSRGTLALSDINLIEFTTFELPHNTQAAGRFADSLLPHLFLMKCDPSKVIECEEAHLVGRLDQSPAGDERALAQFAEAAVRRGGRFSMAAWFNIVHAEREQLKGQLPGIAEVFYAQLRRLRAQREQEPLSLAPVTYREEIALGRPPTQQLMRAIVDVLERDRRVAETTNNAVDLLHTIVPGAYCDFVLLDGQWADRLRSAATRLSKAGIPMRLRATYSNRNGGVEKFLQALEAWPAGD